MRSQRQEHRSTIRTDLAGVRPSRTTVVPAPQHPVRALMGWVAEHCPDDGRVLDVGAGEHAAGGLGPLRRRRPVVVGVDPDAAIDHNLVLAERHRMLVEDFAPDHLGEFDVVLSVFVLEHVQDPVAFATSCASVLKPGGSWFALTLNVHHYFGATAWATQRLGIQPRLLEWMTGKDAHHHDHRFPTHYRLNSRRAVERACDRAGLSEVEFRVYDAPERYSWYLPAPLAVLPPLYTSAVDRYRLAGLMGHLTFRAQRGAEE